MQSAKFITEQKSNNLIKKIESFASKYEAAQLDRQVNGRVKSENTHIYYNVDALHEAISHNEQIEFRYFVWTVDKKMELKHDGHFRVSVKVSVSPMFLGWIMALDGVKIVSPDSAVDKMKERIMQLSEVYLQT